jgi:hypothetical protein
MLSALAPERLNADARHGSEHEPRRDLDVTDAEWTRQIR